MLAIAFALKHFGLLSQPGGRAGATHTNDDSAALCRLRPEVLSPAERLLWAALQLAVGNRYAIFVKVRVGDLLKVEGQGGKPTSARNRIQQKHADFVLCDPKSTCPVIVIELDDRSHQRSERQARDQFVDRAYAAAGVPILHVRARDRYAPGELAREIEERTSPAKQAAGT